MRVVMLAFILATATGLTGAQRDNPPRNDLPQPYTTTRDWGELPPHIKWGNTHGVVEDSQGNIYVHHTVHATSDSAECGSPPIAHTSDIALVAAMRPNT